TAFKCGRCSSKRSTNHSRSSMYPAAPIPGLHSKDTWELADVTAWLLSHQPWPACLMSDRHGERTGDIRQPTTEGGHEAICADHLSRHRFTAGHAGVGAAPRGGAEGELPDYAALNQMENLTPEPPLGLPENATTVCVENGSTVTTK